MKKRTLVTLLLVAAMMLSLVACGSKEEEKAPETSAPSTEQTQEPADTTPDFPTKDIRLIIPYAAGGDGDNMFRCIEAVLPQFLNGHNVVAEFVTGGNAIPGTQQMLDAEPDGYTLCVVAAGNACIQPYMGNATYEVSDFQGVANVVGLPVWFAVAEDAPYNTFAEWKEWVMAHPGEFCYATGSLGGTPHLAMEKMLAATGLKEYITYVPYNGNAEAYAATVGGHVQGYASISSGVIGKEGVKPLLNLGSVTVKGYEDLENLTDIGVDASQMTDVFQGFACHKDVDPAIVEILSNAVKSAMETEEAQQNFANMNTIVDYRNAKEMSQMIVESGEAYKAVIEELGLAS